MLTLEKELEKKGTETIPLPSALETEISLDTPRPEVFIYDDYRINKSFILKKILDKTLSFLAVACLSPVFLLVGLFIKIESAGPVFFYQKRVGKDGNLFTMIKFRSMFVDAEDRLAEVKHLNEADGPLFQIKNDPRITRVGRIIRRLSIDELPQFINVLKGDMSIVGPRPALPREVEEYQDWQMARVAVLPGITGFWQIKGRNELTFDEMIKLDLEYIKNQSVFLDLIIILKTIPAVVKARGAYCL
ncbi:MAG: exopolysaccharide biosynthesis polyprenyl glycosylphosphotransferase [Actinobacteria bacterium]|nr:exopolysaccharide biosynthesis polyprenyl glycosylphosphotransferase [Actinomycetota bacterium]